MKRFLDIRGAVDILETLLDDLSVIKDDARRTTRMLSVKKQFLTGAE
ncbi:hypothetical protein [Hyphomonas sp.]|nr:hypothetical protein [Hyphomonas sp.]MBU3920774.1 hypothetical protein [Alphaproteobacteria bacterium]MBU4061271.1 hypothetical protein [Alphaproteobacteria bacterium]MBU4162524.1 hypothetical protein [Alphaproteobacteria bacterium]